MIMQKNNRLNADAPDLPMTMPTTGALPVVGMVGAAGSRLALEKFFRTLPTDTGLAFIVVTRLAAKEQRLLTTALQARTDLPVLAATDGVLLQSDQIYLVPSGLQPTVAQGRLHLEPMVNPPANRRFDHFLTSLAVEQGANAVALLLSGAGEDGIAGLQAVKAQGGLVLVQEPNEAAHPTLPRRGVAIGLADCVDKVGELAQWLVQSRGDLANLPTTELSQDEHFLQTLPALLGLIASQTGHDLSHYKLSTLQRRMVRRMRAAGAASLLQYLELLKSNVLETVALFRDCLVSVTNFFRDTDAYAMLEHDCIPQLFRGKGRSDLVRVWVAGCATGEEAYSVAMQLAEHAAQLTEPPRWQIFATDLDEAAVTIARRGLYSATVAKDITPARLQRYFTEENGCYRVKPEIRENILFAAHDLLQDPPFSRLDLICCRNVLIYFTRPAQEKVFATFHYALNREPAGRGYLFLGASESVDAANDLFAILNKQCHLYQRRNITLLPTRRPLGNLISAPPVVVENKPAERLPQRATEKPRTLEEAYAAWSLRVHTPPRLLVNQNYEITHLFGGVERYLQTRDGAVTQHVLQRIHPDLRLELRAALYQAFNQRERTISRWLPVALHPRAEIVQLQVGPVAEPGFPADMIEVVLIVQENSPLLEMGATTAHKESDFSLVSRLEEELLRTRERLQQIIDEYETAGQELKVSNEELQSINEELKSTTEELETSKEELQSMNEELTTVNGELTRKLEELHRANSDLLNLIASTEVGAIFLNQQLQINRFTPRATDLFNLIEGDIGRPLAHVTHRLRHGGLPALATQVLATNGHVEETLQRDDNRWFMLRLFPYRTISGENDGVVITFIDIHDLKRAESEERQRRQQQSLAELSRQALTGVDLDTFLTAVTYRVAEVLDMELCKVLELQPDGKALLLKAGVGWQEGLLGHATMTTDTSAQAGYALQSQAPVVVRDLATETRFAPPSLLLDHGVRSGMSVTIPAIKPLMAPVTASTEAVAYGVLGVHSRQVRAFTTYDVDYVQAVANLLAATIARRRTEAALQRSADLLRLSHDAIMVWHPEAGIEFWNHGAETLYGYTAAEALGRITHELLQTDHFRPWAEILAELQHNGAWEGEVHHITKTGRPIVVSTRHQLITNADGELLILETNRDITDRKERAALLARYQLLSEQTRDIILFIGLDGRLVEANEAAVETYGYDRATLLNLTLYDLRAVSTHDLIAEQMAQANQTVSGHGIRFESLHRRRDGSVFPVEVTWIGADVGGERLLLGVIRDITERKAVEAALTASEAKFATAFSLSPLILTITSLTDGRLLEVNESFVQITGYSRAEALGHTPVELGLWVTPDERAEGLARLAAGEIWQNVEALFRMKNGALKTCLLGATVVTINGQACALTALTDITERKAAEGALRQSEERFVTIFQHSPYPIAILALDTRTYVDVNPTWVQETGYTHAEAIGRTAAELGLQSEPSPHLLARLRNGEAVRDQEIQVRMRNGELRTALVSAELIQLTGQPHVLLIFADITARKQAEERLRYLTEEIQRLNRDLKRRVDELQTLLDVAPIGIFVAHDAECQLITSNPAGARMLGIVPTRNASKSNPQEASLPFRVLQNGREVPPAELPMQYAVQHDVTVENVEYDVIRSDGTPISLYEYAIPLHDEEGRVRGCLGIFVDITERKGVEVALRESEERFRSAFEQAAVGMAHVNSEGQYIRVNDRLCQILGYDRAALLQMKFLDLTHPEDRANGLALSERLLAGEIPSYRIEKRYIHHDGATIWVNISASAVRNVAGEISYRLSVIEDITARKITEAALHELTATLEQRVHERTGELERSNRELDQFAYVASHDLKAPLRAIVNLAGWIAEDAGPVLPPPSLEHLHKLHGRALRMERLLDDLLTYSRIGRQLGFIEPVRVDLLLQDTIDLLAPPTGFTVTLTNTMPVLLTPRAPLELVFRNLINNAMKHHHQPTQGVVQIQAQELADFVEFTISDNGPGIAPQFHERIFGMFQTLRPRDEVEGSGMGLAIVKKAVEHHGGLISVESAVGAGTTFRFTWPKQVFKKTE